MTRPHDIDREEIMALLDGELGDDRAAVVRTHLGECRACQLVAAEFSGVSAALSAWDVAPAPATLDARVLEDAAAHGRRSPDAGGWWSTLFGGPRWALAASMAGLLLVTATGLGLWRLGGGNPGPVSVQAGRTAEDVEAKLDGLLPKPAESSTSGASGAAPGPAVAAPVDALLTSPRFREAGQSVRADELGQATGAARRQEAARAEETPARPAAAPTPPVTAGGRLPGGILADAKAIALPSAPPPPPAPALAAPPPAATVTSAAPVVGTRLPAQAPPPPGQVATAADRAGGRGGGVRAGDITGGAAAGSANAAMQMSVLQERTGLRAEPIVARGVSLVLTTDRFEAVQAAIERATATHAGQIDSLTVTATTTTPVRRGLTATIRVPVARLDVMVAELRALGQVREESQTNDDLTSASSELASQLGGARQQETRLRALLAERQVVQDAISVEQELARTRAEISRLETQVRQLAARVASGMILLRVDEG